jgi:hypothetical protein
MTYDPEVPDSNPCPATFEIRLKVQISSWLEPPWETVSKPRSQKGRPGFGIIRFNNSQPNRG